MTIDEAIRELKIFSGTTKTRLSANFWKALDMAISSLEAQKKLAELRGMDICEWVEDYDYDEDNTSEYEFEASVDDFLIDEVKEGKEE